MTYARNTARLGRRGLDGLLGLLGLANKLVGSVGPRQRLAVLELGQNGILSSIEGDVGLLDDESIRRALDGLIGLPGVLAATLDHLLEEVLQRSSNRNSSILTDANLLSVSEAHQSLDTLHRQYQTSPRLGTDLVGELFRGGDRHDERVCVEDGGRAMA